MANDTNIFKNSLASAGYVTPKEWSNAIEQVAREKNIMRGLTGSILIKNRIGTPGNNLYIQKNVALSATDVTDGDSVPISPISFNQVEVVASQIGVATQITLKQLRDQLSTVREDVINNLGLAIAEREEKRIFTELYNTTSAVIYANGKDDSNISSSDTFNVKLLNEGLVAMRIDKRKAMYLVVHPKQEGDLRDLQQFTDASYLGSDRVNREGYIGRFFGVDVFSSTNVVSETATSGTTVYKALLLGDRAAVILDKLSATIDIDRNLIQDLSVTFVAYRDMGVKLLNDESVRVLISA